MTEHITEHESFRSVLETERNRTIESIEDLRGDIASVSKSRRDANLGELDPESAEIAFELSQQGAVLEQSTQHLREVTAALARLDDGSYGICAVCGKEISHARLEARPWTAYCVEHSRGPVR